MNPSQVKKVLEKIGYTSTDWTHYQRRNQIQCRCFLAPLKDDKGRFFHENADDNNFSRGIDIDPTENDAVTNCFACEESGSLSYILKKAYDISGDPKFKKASKICGRVNISTARNRVEKIFENEKELGESEDEDFEDTYDESELDIFERAIHPYILNERNFSVETAKNFELHYDEELKRVLIPVRNKSDNLVGLVGRSIYNEKQREKIKDDMSNKPDYMTRKYIVKYYNYLNFKKSKFLFGINHIEQNPDQVIVVEGCLDVMRLYEYNLPCAVGVFGSSISNEQAQKILELNVPVYLLLDPDTSGERGKEDAIEKIGSQQKVFDAQLPKGSDPDDCSKSQINDVLNDAKLVV